MIVYHFMFDHFFAIWSFQQTLKMKKNNNNNNNKVEKNYKTKNGMYNPLYRITNSVPLGSLSPLKGNTNN